MEIRSQLITGCRSDRVREKGLLNPNMTLIELIAYARTLQVTEAQIKTMHPQSNPVINRLKDKKSDSHQKETPATQIRQNKYRACDSCRNCGGDWPHDGGQNKCPARNKTCRSCNKPHHFASLCLSTPLSTASGGRFTRKSRIYTIDEGEQEE